MADSIPYPYKITAVSGLDVELECTCGFGGGSRIELIQVQSNPGHHIGGNPLGAIQPREVVVFVACPKCGAIKLPPERMP